MDETTIAKWAWAISFRRFTVIFCVSNVLILYPWSHLNTTAVAAITAHVAGFAAIDAFGQVQSLEPFATNRLLACLAVPGFALVLVAIFSAAEAARSAALGSKLEEMEHNIEELIEAEHDVVADSLGKLLNRSARFLIVPAEPGFIHIPPLFTHPKHKT